MIADGERGKIDMNLTEKEKEVILSFADGNMHIGETANLLNLHRNTIDYHLRAIKENTGLDPKNFYDLVELVDWVKMEVRDGKQTD